jgi:IS605 OrfB family transposase
MPYIVQKNHLRRNNVKGFETLKWLSHKCKNLYNSANYLIKTHFQKTGKYLSQKDLFKQIKSHITYTQLSSDNAQLTLRTLRQSYSSYFELLKLKKRGEYKEEVCPPCYRPKDGYFTAQFISRQLKRDGDRVRLSLGKRGQASMGVRYIWVTIPPNIRTYVINMIRIVPRYKGKYFEIEFIYNPEIEIPKFDYSQYLSLDLGLDNFATAVSTRETAFIIEGRGIKSYNRWWNKKMAKVQSQYDKQKIKVWGSKMLGLHTKRYNVIRNYVAHGVNAIVNHCIKYKIGNIVVGDWEDMKRGLKMRKKTAQQFQQIPYSKFKLNLKSKAELFAINLEFVDEAYTSQTCSNCGLIRKSNRIKRGLYRCKDCKQQINADVNGAINILRKVAPEKLLQWSSGDIISPQRLRLVNFGV